jgi:hypothetical protein
MAANRALDWMLKTVVSDLLARPRDSYSPGALKKLDQLVDTLKESDVVDELESDSNVDSGVTLH